MLWTDEQRMEWQANSLAPRILMPLSTFKMKVAEVYSKYCILREPAAGFAEQNGRNAELKRPECGLVTAGAKSKKSRDTE